MLRDYCILRAMLKASGLTLAAKFAQAGLNFIIIILLSRWLVVPDRGEAAFWLMLIAICLAISEIAAGSTVLVLLATHTVALMVRVYALWSALVCFLVMVVAWGIGNVAAETAWILSVAAWFLALLTFCQHLALGKRKWFIFSTSLVITALLPLFFLALFYGYVPKFQVQHYAYSLLLGWLAALLITTLGLWKSGSFNSVNSSVSTSVSVWRNMFTRGILNQLCHLTSLAHNRLPFLLLSASLLGIYANAAALGEAVWMVPGSLGTVLYAKMAGTSPGVYKSRAFSRQLIVGLALSTIAYLVLLLLPSQVFTLLFGEGYAGLQLQLRWLAPGMLAYTIYLMLSYWHSAHDLFAENLKAVLAGLAIGLVVAGILFITTSALSLKGIILAQTMGWATMAAWLLIAYQRRKPAPASNVNSGTG